MNTLAIDRERKFQIARRDGAAYMLVMSGGVFEYEIAIALTDAEVEALLADPDRQADLARRIMQAPDAFEDRRLRPVPRG